MSQVPQTGAVITAAVLENVVGEALHPGHFFAGPGIELIFGRVPAEELPWEIFRGKLLEPAQTREKKVFQSWHVHLVENGQRSGEPLLSIKLDAVAGELHVTRGLLCHVWEAYESAPNVILSREVCKWVRELAGTIYLDDFTTTTELRSELTVRIFQAVIGSSRLPLNSVEAPLPGFSLGQFAFCNTASAATLPMRSCEELIERGLDAKLSWSESAKLLEFVVRVLPPDEIPDTARLFAEHWTKCPGRSLTDLPRLLRTLFNEISLSPYTSFVDNCLAFVASLVQQAYLDTAAQVDFFGYLLRQLGRHLTAYDLITFHYRGANYPDALLLDSVLKAYLGLIQGQPGLFQGESSPSRSRRRALRQACLMRRSYEGHLVPDAPTSPGENARVVPASYERVPEEQLLQTTRRRKRLYEGDPLAGLLGDASRAILATSIRDLCHSDELRELGMAVFVDRPLGMDKAPGEPDQTPLLSHEGFSRSIAERRLRELASMSAELGITTDPGAFAKDLRALPVTGLSVQEVASPRRPAVSLADARRVAEDFIFIRTLPGSLRSFFEHLDTSCLSQLGVDLFQPGKSLLLARPADNPDVLAIWDDRGRRHLELELLLDKGFQTRAGIELPRAGLRVMPVERLPGSPAHELACILRAKVTW